MNIPPRIQALTEIWEASKRGPAPAASALPLQFFADIHGTDEPDDFVEGLLGRGDSSVLYGPPNCRKTFLACDLALHVALGRPWFGRAVEAGAVLYVACEGSGAFKKRVRAFRAGHKLTADAVVPFGLVSASVALRDGQGDVDRVVEAAAATAAQYGMPVVLIVIDTLARAIGGGDENSAADMGGYIRAVDQIRERTGAHVMSVHHTGKNAEHGARGHSSLLGAIDTEISISRDKDGETSTAEVTKQRDFEGGQKWTFKLATVELGTDRRGNAITSCVVRPASRGLPDPRKALKADSPAARAYEILVLMDEQRGGSGVTQADWRARLTAEGVTSSVTGSERTQFSRILTKLNQINAIIEFEGDYFPSCDTRDMARRSVTVAKHKPGSP